ncbi:MAG: hypothetical protein ACEY26_00755 [Candidatus Hodgkinia cicadicola]
MEQMLTLTAIWVINGIKSAVKRYGPSARFAAKVTSIYAGVWFLQLAARIKVYR